MVLREMLVDDLDQVMKIENELFSPPWTKEGFFTYLTRKDAMFLVVEEKGEILAYCGLIMVLDEGDITNVAVRPDRQKEGIGHFLMDSLIRLAEQQGVTTIHLEVRTGNGTAIVKDTVCASIWSNGKIIATGLGILDRNYIGLYAIHVREDFRHKGYARQICTALLKEGKKKGATKAYLQVVEGNTPARNLYESLGLHYLYTYWFRVQTHTN